MLQCLILRGPPSTGKGKKIQKGKESSYCYNHFVVRASGKVRREGGRGKGGGGKGESAPSAGSQVHTKKRAQKKGKEE